MGMLRDLLDKYGVEDSEFLRDSIAPSLERLRLSPSLLLESELGSSSAERPPTAREEGGSSSNAEVRP